MKNKNHTANWNWSLKGRSYVFEPNDTNTWGTVKSMITNILTEKWKQGALAGSSPSLPVSPSEVFLCSFPVSTMTTADFSK